MSPHFTLSLSDIVVVSAYLLISRFFFGWYYGRRASANSEAYFLGGRGLSWWIIGLSFYVSNMSGSSFIGLPGSAYAYGISVFNYEWMPCVILVLFAAFFLPLLYQARVFTTPQYLELRYNYRTRQIFSAFLLSANIFIDAAAALYAGASLVQSVYPSVPIGITVFALALLAGVYICFGGLNAVVANDAVQALLILLGASVVAVMSYLKAPSWSELRELTPPGYLHLWQPIDDPVLPWLGVPTGLLLIGIYFWCFNQFVVQRALAARSLEHGRWGALFAGALKLPNLFILVLPGIFAIHLYPDLERPDLVFPTLVFDLLPDGFRGIVIAAVAAAILSSLEAIFNSASTLFTMDFYRHARPKASEQELVRVGRAATAVAMLGAALWAPQILRFPTLWDYLQSILAYAVPPTVAVLLLGMFWRRANAIAANASLLLGLLGGIIAWILGELLALYTLHFLYASTILFFCACLSLFLISLCTEAPSQESAQYCWSPQRRREERARMKGVPLRYDYRLPALLLLLLTAGLVWIWL